MIITPSSSYLLGNFDSRRARLSKLFRETHNISHNSCRCSALVLGSSNEFRILYDKNTGGILYSQGNLDAR